MRIAFLLASFVIGCAGSARLVVFEQNGEYGYKNREGRVVIEPRFREAQPFLKGGVALVFDSLWCYINERGDVVFDAYFFDNGPDYVVEERSRITKNGKIGFIDNHGEIVVEPTFDFAAPFSDGMAAFCEGCWTEPSGEHRRILGGKWGFVDRNGNVVIPAKYDRAWQFENGKAEVGLDGQTIIIDRKGEILKRHE